jgi:CheY-like chemotaxis protein
MQRARAADKGLALHVVMPDDLPDVVVGDELRFRQVLQNLVSNAVKFTSGGGITVSVAARERRERRVLLDVAVTDTGIGVPAELTGAIFNPFVQADSSITRRYGGTGLGLTICRRLTELMGGQIEVESVEGVGSTFRVLLPLAVVEQAAEEAAPAPVSPSPLWAGAALRILVAEDDATSRQFEGALLQKMGHRVTSVEHGEDALAALELGPFDLVLMDIQMPVMDGRRALAALRDRETGTSAHVPVIAVTAHASKSEERGLLAAGFDGYVRKPIRIAELASEMKRVLGSGEASDLR